MGVFINEKVEKILQWQKILGEKDKKKKGDHQTVVAVIVE